MIGWLILLARGARPWLARRAHRLNVARREAIQQQLSGLKMAEHHALLAEAESKHRLASAGAASNTH